MYSEGVARIAAERRRQVEEEGWTADHDALHRGEELAMAATCYAMPPHARWDHRLRWLWPWTWRYYKPGPTRVRELTKAGALIAAEIDRLLAEAVAEEYRI